MDKLLILIIVGIIVVNSWNNPMIGIIVGSIIVVLLFIIRKIKIKMNRL